MSKSYRLDKVDSNMAAYQAIGHMINILLWILGLPAFSDYSLMKMKGLRMTGNQVSREQWRKTKLKE